MKGSRVLAAVAALALFVAINGTALADNTATATAVAECSYEYKGVAKTESWAVLDANGVDRAEEAALRAHCERYALLDIAGTHFKEYPDQLEPVRSVGVADLDKFTFRVAR